VEKVADAAAAAATNVVIFDLGGGTFDVSVLAMEGGVFEVRKGTTTLAHCDTYTREQQRRRISAGMQRKRRAAGGRNTHSHTHTRTKSKTRLVVVGWRGLGCQKHTAPPPQPPRPTPRHNGRKREPGEAWVIGRAPHKPSSVLSRPRKRRARLHPAAEWTRSQGGVPVLD